MAKSDTDLFGVGADGPGSTTFKNDEADQQGDSQSTCTLKRMLILHVAV